MRTVQLDKINIKFRHLVDLLMFSNRTDIDLQDFDTLLHDNYSINLYYLLDRFKKSCEIFWEDNEFFWVNRLSFLFSLNDKPISKGIGKHLEKRMFSLVKNKHDLNEKYDLAYVQYISYCKVLSYRKESLLSIRNYLAELPSRVATDKLIKIINSFIPIVFNSIDEYAAILSHKIVHSARNFDILQALEKQNIEIERQPLVKLAKEIMVERERSDKNILAFFSLINDSIILEQLKCDYTSENKKSLLDFLSSCNHKILEDFHYRNIRNIISLDRSIADELSIIYISKLYSRRISHRRANIDKVIRLLNMFPEISPKKILVHLSSNNKMYDIKYMILAFPSLRKLVPFM